MNNKAITLAFAAIALAFMAVILVAFSQHSKLNSAVVAICEYDARTQTVDSQNACGLAAAKANVNVTCSNQKCEVEAK